MPHVRRRVLAALFALVAALGFDVEAVVHLHPDCGVELTAHELATAEPGVECDRAPHLDSAHLAHHRACAACLVSMIPGERLGTVAITPSPMPRGDAEPAPASLYCPSGCVLTRFGRAPPAPPSSIV